MRDLSAGLVPVARELALATLRSGPAYSDIPGIITPTPGKPFALSMPSMFNITSMKFS
jgi:hypothetical protein